MRAAPLLLVLACAPPEAEFAVDTAALTFDDIAQLQVSMLTGRSTVQCDQVTKGCVKDQFPTTRFVDLQDASGASHKALRFSRDAGIEIRMAPGKDFALVIEALTASPAQLAGSSCSYVEAITAGSNRVTANPLVIRADAGVVSSCDPTLD